jgi:hypothetical protein
MHIYTETDKYLHWLSQIIAKANRTFVPKKEDDSHTNLYYDSLGNRIAGRWIKSTEGNIIFTLNLDNQAIEIMNTSFQVLASVSTISYEILEIEKKIEALLPQWGLDPNGFFSIMHYEIPTYDFAKLPVKVIDQKSLKEWAKFRYMANEACFLLLGYAQKSHEVRIWPHHFDTGIYFKIKKNLSLGFGLAMEDKMAGSPYFYFAAYPSKGKIEYQNLPKGKEWRWELSENWQGAILPIEEFKDRSDKENYAILKKYLLETYNWFASR